MATFCMLRQIYLAYKTLMVGLQQVKKIEEEAMASHLMTWHGLRIEGFYVGFSLEIFEEIIM